MLQVCAIMTILPRPARIYKDVVNTGTPFVFYTIAVIMVSLNIVYIVGRKRNVSSRVMHIVCPGILVPGVVNQN